MLKKRSSKQRNIKNKVTVTNQTKEIKQRNKKKKKQNMDNIIDTRKEEQPSSTKQWNLHLIQKSSPKTERSASINLWEKNTKINQINKQTKCPPKQDIHKLTKRKLRNTTCQTVYNRWSF